MPAELYGMLAGVYDWFVPEGMLEPEGSAAAFAELLAELPAKARMLDCAAGTGALAVGLALRGHAVSATDASVAMIARTRALASQHGVGLRSAVCRWDELTAQGFRDEFDAVWCVGNSLMHARGQAGRIAALKGMAVALQPGGTLVLTSRNWERVRAHGSGIEVTSRLIERGGRTGLVIHGWNLAPGWDDEHTLDAAVAILSPSGAVTTHAERLPFWPFTHQTLATELRAAGLVPSLSTYSAETDRYLVSATR